MSAERLRLLCVDVALDILWSSHQQMLKVRLNMKAMILAAGRGERMRPLTDQLPKPLLEIDGKSLIKRNIESLLAAGVRDFVVNTAWLAETLHSALGDGSALGVRIVYSDEGASALETGGGIKKALPLLGAKPFWLVNADVLSDYSYPLQQLPPGDLAHLVLVENPRHNPHGDFALRGGRMVEPVGAEDSRYTFAGISLLSPELLHLAPAGDTFPLAPLLRAAATEGSVGAELYQGLWMDIGTADRLRLADDVLSGR
jgi:MurNAc alpha-1-phosphate uridylyltransferase